VEGVKEELVVRKDLASERRVNGASERGASK